MQLFFTLAHRRLEYTFKFPVISVTAEILLGNDIAELPRLSAFVSAFCAQHGLSAEVDMALNVAAEEVFVNVVQYGYSDRDPHSVRFNLEWTQEAVVLIAEDDAKPFNPLELPEFDPSTPIEQRRAGGLGVHLLRKLMTTVSYERDGDINRLTMRKTLLAENS